MRIAIGSDHAGYELKECMKQELAALGHSSFDATIRFPVTAQKRGTIEFQTPTGGQISVLGIRFNPSMTFSTVPVIAK